MAEPITLQELRDASEDALTLKDFMYKPSNVLISRRLAPDIQSLQYYLDFLHGLELVYSQQSGTVVVNGVATKTVTQAVQDAINSNASVFKGDKGDTGTIDVGTTTTGAAGSAVSVTASGTPTARVFNFTIPRGDKGETGTLPNIYATTTLETPNVHIASDGTFKRSNDTANASTRKVGTATGNLVERGADGYPKNNNALGVGQTWQDVKATRARNVSYTNTTGRAICVSVTFSGSSGLFELIVASVVVASLAETTTSDTAMFTIVPSGSTYQVTASTGVVQTWSELR